MAKGGKAKPATTVQQIGNDPLTKGIAGSLLGQINKRQTASTSGSTKQGVRTIGAAGQAGGLRDPSLSAIGDVVSGKFLDPNVLGAEIEAASAPALRNFRRSIAPSIASEFAAAGRTGSGAEQAAFTDANDALSRNIAEVASGAVSGERGRQLQAAGFLPSLVDSELRTGQAQIGAGQAVEALQREQRGGTLNRLLQIGSALPGLRTSTSTGARQGSGKGGALGTLAGGAAGAFLGPVGSAAGASLGNALFTKGAG